MCSSESNQTTLTQPSLALKSSTDQQTQTPKATTDRIPTATPTTELLLFDSSSTLDLLFRLPPSLLSLLINASPAIDLLAQLSLILRWSHPAGPWNSWLLLLLWAALCLLLPITYKFGAFNLICAFLIILPRLKSFPLPSTTHPSLINSSANPQLLLNTLQSFQVLADHFYLLSLSFSPFLKLIRWHNPQRSYAACWTCLTSLPFSLLVTRLIPLRFIFFFAGSIAILWSAHWFKLLRQLLWRSASIRWSSRLAIELCIHAGLRLPNYYQHGAHHNHSIKLWPPLVSLFYLSPPPSTPLSTQPLDQSQEAQSPLGELPVDAQQIEFRFTIFENQRWWMGLDWTPTLLPHERPNWSDYLNHPVSSPSHFKLPAPVLSLEPAANRQRRVEWRWVDQDWIIADAHPGIQHPHPDHSKPISSVSRLGLKSLSKKPASVRDRTTPTSSPLASPQQHDSQDPAVPQVDNSPPGSANLDAQVVHQSPRALGFNSSIIEGRDPAEAWDVDSNGWQYGDNHWEKLSRKAGIGRYTRRRAWIRRALMVTSFEPLDPASQIIELASPARHLNNSTSSGVATNISSASLRKKT